MAQTIYFGGMEAAAGAAVPNGQAEAPEGVRPAPARRNLQDYSNMLHCLTPSLWDLLRSSQPMQVRADKLFEHVYKLGLRAPSEGTFAIMTILVNLDNEQGLFAVHSSYKAVKTIWRSMCQKKARFDTWRVEECPDRLENVVTLPFRAQEAFELEREVDCPVPADSILQRAERIPKRSTNSAIPSSANGLALPGLESAQMLWAGLLAAQSFNQGQQGRDPLQIQYNVPSQPLPGRPLAILDRQSSNDWNIVPEPRREAPGELAQASEETTNPPVIERSEENPGNEGQGANNAFAGFQEALAGAVLKRPSAKSKAAPKPSCKRPAAAKAPAKKPAAKAPAAKKKVTKASKAKQKRAVQVESPREGDTLKRYASRAYHSAKKRIEKEGGDAQSALTAAREAHQAASAKWRSTH